MCCLIVPDRVHLMIQNVTISTICPFSEKWISYVVFTGSQDLCQQPGRQERPSGL